MITVLGRIFAPRFYMMSAVGIRRDTPPGVSGVRAGIFADTRGRVSLHIVRKKQGLLQEFCNKPLLFQMPKNSFQPAMKSLAWEVVGASAAMRSSGSVPEKRQMTQLPFSKTTLQPSPKVTRSTGRPKSGIRCSS